MDEATLFKKHIAECKNSIVHSLSTGHAKDYAEYREMCGRLHGLNTALLQLEEAEERQQRDD